MLKIRYLKRSMALERALDRIPAQEGSSKVTRRRTIADCAVDVLHRTNNPAVMFGDPGLLDLIAAEASHTGLAKLQPPNLRWARVLDGLEGDLRFKKSLTRCHRGHWVRLFRLVEPPPSGGNHQPTTTEDP